MKCLKHYGYLSRQSSLSTPYTQIYYRSIIIPAISSNNSSSSLISYQHNFTTIRPHKRHCTNDSSSSSSSSSSTSSSAAPQMSAEQRLKQSFISKYQRKIQKSSTSEAWNRYEKEIKPTETGPMAATNPQEKFYQDFETPEYETPKEKEYDPHRIFAMPRATFRGLIIGLSCLIGATCFVILRPSPIGEEKERSNMHYFAKLNADPNVHVTYSGLMYRILDQVDLRNEETDLNLLTNPNPDIHCCNIDYEGRFIDGTVFDTTFEEHGMKMTGSKSGCTFPAKSLIPGLHQGLQNMTRESIFEFYLPPHLAYGERGSEFIPPHEPLIFKVRLNDFWKDQDVDRPRRFKLIN